MDEWKFEKLHSPRWLLLVLFLPVICVNKMYDCVLYLFGKKKIY